MLRARLPNLTISDVRARIARHRVKIEIEKERGFCNESCMTSSK